MNRYLGASDAAYDANQGSGRFLLVLLDADGNQARLGRVPEILENWYHMWQPCETYIAQLELVMILCALVHFAPQPRGNR